MSNSIGTPSTRFNSTPPPVDSPPPSHLAVRSPSASASDIDLEEVDVEEEDQSAEESDLDLLDERVSRSSTILLNPAIATTHPITADSSTPWPYTSASQVAPALNLITAYPPIQIPASSLPHEILLHILRSLTPAHLSPALLVCKAWCQCGVELLWHKPSFNNMHALTRMLVIIGSTHPHTLLEYEGHDIEDTTMTIVASPVPYDGDIIVTTPTLTSFQQHQQAQSQPLAIFDPSSQLLLGPGTTFPYPNFIRRLNFSSLAGSVTDAILLRLIPCTHLERLTLASCNSLTSPALCELLRYTKRLVALDLSEVTATEDCVLEEAARGCRRLQGLNLSGCLRVSDLGVEAIARGCPGLRRVSFMEFDAVGGVVLTYYHHPQIKLRAVHLLTDVPIILLSLSCPLLLEVDMVGCQLITAKSLFQLFRTSSHLRELSLAGCSEVDDTGFPPGSQQDSEMMSQQESDRSMTAPAFLTTLTGGPIPTPIPLYQSPSLAILDHLRYLDLTQLSLLTDNALEGIVKYMPRIRNLILAKCVGITDDGIDSICKLGKALHYLHLGHVSS